MILTVTIKCSAPMGQAVGVKEQIAQDLEKYGDVKVVSIVSDEPEQKAVQQSMWRR